MANHKRGRPKNARSGCLFCKPHKVNGVGKLAQPLSELKAREAESYSEDDEPVTGIICRRFTYCPDPERCQERCDTQASEEDNLEARVWRGLVDLFGGLDGD